MAQCITNQVMNTAGTTETAQVRFIGFNGTSGSAITVAGLTLTVNGNKTANDLALKFANLINGATGTSSGSLNFSGALSGWTSGPVTVVGGDTVVFTSVTANSNVANIVVSSNGAPAVTPAVVTTDGTTSGTAFLNNLLLGNTACLGTVGNWQNQELHVSGGNLIDYKKGPAPAGNPDPSTSVGGWTITGSGTSTVVNYTYGATTYTYKVFGTASPYTFCLQPGNAPTYSVGIKTGGGACP